eukprot:COSAG06_NODE_911_length_11587_cov_2.115164_8_plen_119_part_00
MVWRGDVMCTQIEGLQPSERRTFEQAIASAYGKDATRGDAYKLLQAGAASAKDGAHQEAIETFWTGLRMPKLPRDLKAKFEAGIKSSNDAIAQALQAKMEEEAVRKRQRLLNFNIYAK